MTSALFRGHSPATTERAVPLMREETFAVIFKGAELDNRLCHFASFDTLNVLQMTEVRKYVLRRDSNFTKGF